LTEKDYHVIVVSNQAGVGKGLMTTADLQEITRNFVEEVEAQRGRIRSVYYCTHRAEDDCQCRKPKPGLLLNAQAEHPFIFKDTFLIGDSESFERTLGQLGKTSTCAAGDRPQLTCCGSVPAQQKGI
jgi:D-glycero-D-manno-heptose 1,7-bisphosphate phosphatase